MAVVHRQIVQQIINRRLPRPMVFSDRENPLEYLNEVELFKRYRFRRDTIVFIVNMVDENVRRTTERSLPVPPVMVVCAFLRYVATGDMQLTVADSLNLSQSTVNRCCRVMSDLLSSEGMTRRFIFFPKGQEAIDMKQRFGSIAGFPNVIGCLDGTHVSIRKPKANDRTEDYMGRKGATLNVQEVCDVDYKLRYVQGRWPGRMHDARCWRNSYLKLKFENGTYQGILLGDSGYPTTRYLMTPYLQPANAAENRFNRRLCRTRVLIEQTFGILKQRFQITEKKIRAKPTRAGKYVVSCSVLHNIGIDRHDIVDVPRVVPAFDPRIDHIAGARVEGRAMRQHITNTYFV